MSVRTQFADKEKKRKRNINTIKILLRALFLMLEHFALFFLAIFSFVQVFAEQHKEIMQQVPH